MAIQSFEEVVLERLAKLQSDFDDLRGVDRAGSNIIGVGQVAFGNANNRLASEPLLFWDNTNKRLGIGTNSPAAPLHISPASGNIFALMGTGGTGSGNNTYLWFDRTAATGGAVNIAAFNSGIGGATIQINKLFGGFVDINQIPYQNATLQNGWVNASSPWYSAQYGKDSNGYVHLRGLITSGTTAVNTVLFNLPVGYRPLYYTMFPTISNGAFAVFDVAPNGDVMIRSGASAAWFALFTGHFQAEQ